MEMYYPRLTIGATRSPPPPCKFKLQLEPGCRVRSPAMPSDAAPASLPSPSTAVFLQKACVQHRYIRSRDTSCIVERPERLRAVHVGLAAAAARLEEASTPRPEPSTNAPNQVDNAQRQTADADELTSALGRLNLANSSATGGRRSPVQFVHSDASVDVLNNAAGKFIHGDIEGDVYLENLKRWAAESRAKIDKGESVIPEGLSQGDLYRMSFQSISILVPTTCLVFSVPGVIACNTRRFGYCVPSG